MYNSPLAVISRKEVIDAIAVEWEDVPLEVIAHEITPFMGCDAKVKLSDCYTVQHVPRYEGESVLFKNDEVIIWGRISVSQRMMVADVSVAVGGDNYGGTFDCGCYPIINSRIAVTGEKDYYKISLTDDSVKYLMGVVMF